MIRWNRIGFVLMVLICFVLVACVAPTSQQRRSSARKTTWNPASGFCCADGWSPAGDVNGEVGHPLSINGPTARCWRAGSGPPNTREARYSVNVRVASGQLPPGLSMNGIGAINGIPSERGHWIVRLEVYGALCDGVSYPNMSSWGSEIRFHITGSGQVVR
jgi:hypothetical protein